MTGKVDIWYTGLAQGGIAVRITVVFTLEALRSMRKLLRKFPSALNKVKIS